MRLFTIYDRAIESHGNPFFQPTANAAIRMMKTETQREGSMVNQHPEDYELWQIGELNEVTGDFTPEKTRIARAQDLKGPTNA